MDGNGAESWMIDEQGPIDNGYDAHGRPTLITDEDVEMQHAIEKSLENAQRRAAQKRALRKRRNQRVLRSGASPIEDAEPEWLSLTMCKIACCSTWINRVRRVRGRREVRCFCDAQHLDPYTQTEVQNGASRRGMHATDNDQVADDDADFDVDDSDEPAGKGN